MSWVNAKLVDDVDADDAPAGAFGYFSAGNVEYAGLLFVCPCGCGKRGDLAFKPVPSPSWNWDGKIDRPTLTPSVRSLNEDGTEHWHGFLERGTWTKI